MTRYTCPTPGCEVRWHSDHEPGFCSICLQDLVPIDPAVDMWWLERHERGEGPPPPRSCRWPMIDTAAQADAIARAHRAARRRHPWGCRPSPLARLRTLLGLVIVLGLASSASASSARCGNLPGPPAPQIGELRASGTSCAVARGLARAWRRDRGVTGWHDCPDARHTCGAIGRFRCTEYAPDPRYPGAFMFCRRGHERVRWSEA